MAVHQLVPNFVMGDATSQAAIHLSLLLRRLGRFGEVFSGEVSPNLSSLVRPASQLRVEPEDLVLYHHAIASPLSGALLHLPCRRGVVFHNITPARFYEGTLLREALESGRAQLAAMAPFAELAIGVSAYNAAELREAGCQNVHVVPLFVEPERFSRERADRSMLRRLSGRGPLLLSVGRVVPHKRIEDLIALYRELLRLRPEARLAIAGGFQRGDQYYRKLRREVSGCPGVQFLGKLSHAELVAAYRSAQLFVSMSEHEGFGVAPLEAMAAAVPVLAFAAAAVPETLGGAGIAFTEKRFALLAELCRELLDDPRLRARVLAGQKRRLEELSAGVAERHLSAALSSIDARPSLSRRAGEDQGEGHPLSRGAGDGTGEGGRKRRPRVALVVQRYGELLGGAESHARQIAHRLSPHWEVTVLTSCARDHLSWANELPEGVERDGPVRVRRFASARARQMRDFNRLSRAVFGRGNDRVTEEHWLAEQGPLLPGLWRHLSEEGRSYDGFVLFTYLYAPTAWGLPMVADRALVVPTAHDEAPFFLDVFNDVLEQPRALLCNTPEEVELIERRCPRHARARVVGVGVDLPGTNAARFRKSHQVAGPYLMYVGRVEEGKGVGELLRLYRRCRARLRPAPELVLAGPSSMEAGGEGVRYLGRISERDKHDGLSGALAAVVPSRYESLSLLSLEAFAAGTPVLGNGASEVVKGQLSRSGAGAAYDDGDSFVEGIRRIEAERPAMRRKALAYARRQSWAKVVAAYREEMARILEERR
ncbi:MAG: glycosyltransferase family 4 protein [Myxococcales bacterium]|nr:glycosyltransferase family 4 protein [Myxococcales bacterium]